MIIIKSDNYTVEATATTKNPGNATIVSTVKQNKKWQRHNVENNKKRKRITTTTQYRQQ